MKFSYFVCELTVYILQLVVRKNSVSYIIAVVAPSTKVVKITLSIAVYSRGLAKNHFWLVATRKKRIREKSNYFWNMCPKPFSWAKNRGKLFLDGKSRGLLLARMALKFAIVEKNSSIFSILVEPYRPRVPPMIRTLSINRLKHHLPKWKVISLFLPPTIFDKTSYLSHYMQKKRVAWHPKERLPMKLAVIRSENIEVYTSFNNSVQGNGQSWTNETSVRSLLQTTRCEKTPHLSHNALKKCVAWHPR